MTDPIRFFWFIPTHGDGSYLGSSVGERQPDFRYFAQIAQAADRLGYEGVLLPTGQNCEESWITATGLATLTERLKFLVALRPGVTLPSFAARQTAALDRLSSGRLLLNVVVGGNPVELAGDGVFLEHDERYAQAAEFLTIWRGLLRGETVDFVGKHYRIEAGRLASWAALRTPARSSLLNNATHTSPGASRPPTSPLRSRTPASAPRLGAEGLALEYACTSSFAKPKTQHGPKLSG